MGENVRYEFQWNVYFFRNPGRTTSAGMAFLRMRTKTVLPKWASLLVMYPMAMLCPNVGELVPEVTRPIVSPSAFSMV